MRVIVDADNCTACELCVSSCPDVFEMQGDVAVAKVDPVPDDQAECAKAAAEDCPVEAISVEEQQHPPPAWAVRLQAEMHEGQRGDSQAVLADCF